MSLDKVKVREEIPVQLDRLKDVNPDQAERIEDVFSFVLYELRQNDVRDWTFVEALIEAIEYGFGKVRARGV